MNTHIIITGHARSFARCWPNLLWDVVRQVQSPVIHASVDPDTDAVEMERILKASGLPFTFRTVSQPPQEAFPDYGDAHKHAPYAISVSPYAVMAQLWRMADGYEAAKGAINPGDCVIRMRPDLWFHELVAWDHVEWRNCAILHPWWGNFGGMNDRFAIMPAKHAPAYFNAWHSVKGAIEAGCPLHPESLLAYACREIPSMRANFLFSTIRATGQQRWPEVLPGEIPPR